MKINFHTSVLNETYKPHLRNYEGRYKVFYGGGGSGKSHFVFQRMVLKALTDQRKILVIRKVDRTIKDSVWQMTLDTLASFGILGECRINKSDFTITLPNGSSFLFKGLQDPERIKSIAGITDVIIEEATELNYEDFNQLDIRLRHPFAKNQEMVLMFNPVSKVNWCYKHWFEEKDPRATVLHTTYKDNRFLPQSQIETLEGLKRVNETYYKIYCLGEFGSLNKLVFENWKVEDFDSSKVKGEFVIGLDFGYVNDPTALVAAIVDNGNKKIYIIDEMYEKGLLNNEIAKRIKDRGYGKSLIVADSAEQKSIEEIKRQGVPRIKECRKGPGSVLQGIQLVQQYEIIIHPSCTNMVEELQNYSWKKDKQTNEYINTPVDAYNHLIDSLRYACSEVCSLQKLRSTTKAGWGI